MRVGSQISSFYLKLQPALALALDRDSRCALATIMLSRRIEHPCADVPRSVSDHIAALDVKAVSDSRSV